jgi:hypothetical protein
MTRNGAIASGAALLLAATVFAGTPEDDLAVVKKAVARAQETRPPDSEAKVKESLPKAEASPARKGTPQWLKVRVVEKGSKKGKVSINVPLSLARALGDDFPIDWHCHRRRSEDREDRKRERCEIRLSEVLAALEAGQDLVEVDDDDTTVRVWVE